MNWIDIAVALALIGWVIIALRAAHRKKGCCGDCANCQNCVRSAQKSRHI